MTTTIMAIFDGEVLRPERPVELKPNTRYRLTVEQEVQEVGGPSAWDILEKMIGTVDAPEDWAAEHDHYLYGTPKRNAGPAT